MDLRLEKDAQPPNDPKRQGNANGEQREFAEQGTERQQMRAGELAVPLLEIVAKMPAGKVVDGHRADAEDHQGDGGPKQHGAHAFAGFSADAVKPAQPRPPADLLAAVLQQLAQNNGQNENRAEHDMNTDEVG